MIKEVVMPRHTPQWCKHVSKKGDVCSLYLEHYGPHKSDHGKTSWDVDNE